MSLRSQSWSLPTKHDPLSGLRLFRLSQIAELLGFRGEPLAPTEPPDASEVICHCVLSHRSFLPTQADAAWAEMRDKYASG